MRAHFKQANDDPLGAVADFGTVIKLDPTNNTALGKRARILANTGHKKEALAAFEQWQRAYPNFPSVYFYKGRFEHDIGLWQQAIKDLQSAVSKSNGKEAPGNVYLLPNPGTRSHSMDNKNYKLSWIMQTEILGQLGQADAALYDADQILRADPNCDAMLSLRQKLLRQKGRWADAIRDLDKLIALDADVSDFYQWRGEAYQHLNKKEKAEADLAKAKHIEQYGQ
jgi:tetratricopeptide (TPR) repeat protein